MSTFPHHVAAIRPWPPCGGHVTWWFEVKSYLCYSIAKQASDCPVMSLGLQQCLSLAFCLFAYNSEIWIIIVLRIVQFLNLQPDSSIRGTVSYLIQMNKTSKDDTISGTRTQMVGYPYNQYRLSHSPIYQWCFWLIINVDTTVVWWENSKKQNGFSFIQKKVPWVKWWRMSVHTELILQRIFKIFACICGVFLC